MGANEPGARGPWGAAPGSLPYHKVRERLCESPLIRKLYCRIGPEGVLYCWNVGGRERRFPTR